MNHTSKMNRYLKQYFNIQMFFVMVHQGINRTTKFSSLIVYRESTIVTVPKFRQAKNQGHLTPAQHILLCILCKNVVRYTCAPPQSHEKPEQSPEPVKIDCMPCTSDKLKSIKVPYFFRFALIILLPDLSLSLTMPIEKPPGEG